MTENQIEEELRRLRRVREVAQWTVDNDPRGAYSHLLKAALRECFQPSSTPFGVDPYEYHESDA